MSLLLATACGGRTTTVRLTGNIEGAPNHLVLLREASDNTLYTIDTTRTDSLGFFSMIINVESPSFYLLQIEDEDEPIVLLVEGGENVKIEGEKGSFARNYSISGSRGSLLVRDLNARLNQTVGKIDSLAAYFRSNRDHPRFDSIKREVDSAYFKAIDNHKRYTVDFIKQNRYSLASILALYQQYDKDLQVLNKREDFLLFQMVDSVLFPLYPGNILVVNLHENVKKISRQLALYDRRADMIPVGEAIPIFELPLINNDTMLISDLRFRYALIDFWATWCNDCIPNNRKLMHIYGSFAPKGFQIVQISLDDNPKQLRQTIESDSLQWVHVVDYRQWDSPIVDSFHINSIPSNYLIDRHGVIVGANLNPKELKEMLQKLMP